MSRSKRGVARNGRGMRESTMNLEISDNEHGVRPACETNAAGRSPWVRPYVGDVKSEKATDGREGVEARGAEKTKARVGREDLGRVFRAPPRSRETQARGPQEAARCAWLDSDGCRCLARAGHRGPHDPSYTPYSEGLGARFRRPRGGGA